MSAPRRRLNISTIVAYTAGVTTLWGAMAACVTSTLSWTQMGWHVQVTDASTCTCSLGYNSKARVEICCRLRSKWLNDKICILGILGSVSLELKASYLHCCIWTSYYALHNIILTQVLICLHFQRLMGTGEPMVSGVSVPSVATVD